jgi:hypothetical protein
MSDNIAKMDVKQLRKEVQSLRDELAMMKRKYEDIIYNLDTDNFSGRFIKEQDNMRTSIEVTAKGIKSMVSKADLDGALTQYSTISQTASKISSEVKKLSDKDDELFTKITQTADSIESTVKNVVSDTYIKNALGDEYVTSATFSSTLDQTANGIYAEVSSIYETKENADVERGALYDSITSVTVAADRISSRVEHLEDGKLGNYTVFEQTADGFKLSGDVKQVNGEIYIGDYTTIQEKKHIYFNNQAAISTVDSGVGQNGIAILCNRFEIHEKPNDIHFISPDGGSFVNDSITLEEYVSQYAGSGGGVAKFG